MTATLLRDGRTVDDPRLDLIPYTDPRSLARYPVAELLEAPPGRPDRGRTWRAGPVLDQGQEGACVGFAFAAELAANPVPGRLSERELDALARRLYRRAQDLDPWEETRQGGAEGTSITAGAQAFVEAGYAVEYRWARDVEEALRVLTTRTDEGDVFGPIIVAVEWRDGMYDTDARGRVDVSGRLVGYHALLLRGALEVVKPDPLIRWRNSWGQPYGDEGDGLIRASDLEAIAGPTPELCVPVLRRR